MNCRRRQLPLSFDSRWTTHTMLTLSVFFLFFSIAGAARTQEQKLYQVCIESCATGTAEENLCNDLLNNTADENRTVEKLNCAALNNALLDGFDDLEPTCEFERVAYYVDLYLQTYNKNTKNYRTLQSWKQSETPLGTVHFEKKAASGAANQITIELSCSFDKRTCSKTVFADNKVAVRKTANCNLVVQDKETKEEFKFEFSGNKLKKLEGKDVVIRPESDRGGQFSVIIPEPDVIPGSNGEEGSDEVEGDHGDGSGPVEPEKIPDPPRRIWTWIVGGTGIAAGVAGTITWAAAYSKYNDFMDECGSETDNCDTGHEAQRDKADNLALAGDILIPVAAVGIAAGVFLFFKEPGYWEKNNLSVLPTGSGKSAGVVISGRF